MKCLIIAAGKGRRLSGLAESKPLLEVGHRPLIEWVIRSSRRAGVRDFVVVTGYAADKVESHLERLSRRDEFTLSFVRNDEWEKENGLSIFKAKEAVGEKFILSMSDHIFDPAIVLDLSSQEVGAGEVVLAVDFHVRDNADVDLDDVTKVLADQGKIKAIGKTLTDYNAFDTGLFLCTSGIFKALEESQRRGDFTLSGGIMALAAENKVRVMDIGGRFWIDVDDERALAKAETRLKSLD